MEMAPHPGAAAAPASAETGSRAAPGHRAGLFIIIAAVALACGDSASGPRAVAPVAGLERLAGDAQAGIAGGLFAIEPRVLAVDGNGAPLPGAELHFSIVSGGGATSDTVLTTGSDGTVSIGWYAGANPGPNVLRVSGGSVSIDFSAAAAMGAPGQSYFGRNGYVEYLPGDLPIIISAPHGGTLTPAEIPDRAGPDVTTVRDVATEELARTIQDAFFSRTGRRPHVVICRLRRTKLDANRERLNAALNNRFAERAWFEFHSFIEAASASAVASVGWGLYMDLHGHGHPIARLELGYLLEAADLDLSDATLSLASLVNESSLRSLVGTSGSTHAQLLRGEFSLGALFASKGYPSVPSPGVPTPGTTDYFSGGYNTARHGSSGGGTVSGFQLEAHSPGVRDTEQNRQNFAAALVDVFDVYLERHYAFDLSQSATGGQE